jgi:hypothetical protein
MEQINTYRTWLAIGIIISCDKMPKIVRGVDISRSVHVISDESFEIRNGEHNHNGPIFDWLRNKDNIVIGVRFVIMDEPSLKFVVDRCNVVSLEAEGYRSTFNIFFGSERQFEPEEPLFLETGGNELYLGDKGSTMLTFYLVTGEKFLGE